MIDNRYWSRLKNFFQLTVEERQSLIGTLPLDISADDFFAKNGDLPLEQANLISENVIGTFSLPLSVAPNFLVDGRSVLVPMVTEEPSIVAACSKMAKLVGLNGGFTTTVDRALTRGQMQFYGFFDLDAAVHSFLENRADILVALNQKCPSMVARGGGVIALEYKKIATKNSGPMLIIEPLIDTVDAMGANMVNTLLEESSALVQKIIGGQLGIRILSNLCDERLATAVCRLPFRALAVDDDFDHGESVAKKMLAAHEFAEADVYRACTHNKGVLNGIDALAIASGNDFRAIEAGAHAFASRSGRYLPLTNLSLDHEKSELSASLRLPLAVGTVGGISNFHNGVKLGHKILGEHGRSSKKLASVMVSVGLAQCLAALFALSTKGIQKGHMALHHKKLTLSKSARDEKNTKAELNG